MMKKLSGFLPLLAMLIVVVAIGPCDAVDELDSVLQPALELTGDWAGSATLTSNCANPACRWSGGLNPPSVEMTLVAAGNNVAGTVTMNLPAGEVLIAGSTCGPLTGPAVPINGTVSSSSFTFTDPGGNVWDMSFTSDLLSGTISNSEPGCLGFQGDVSLSKQ